MVSISTGLASLLVTVQRTLPQYWISVDPVKLRIEVMGEGWSGSIKSALIGVMEIEAPESKTKGCIWVELLV